jgi:DNA-binding response OmpR family regulator
VESFQPVADRDPNGPASLVNQVRVLVIDDEDAPRRDLIDALTPRYRVPWATSVEQGLALRRSIDPDLIIIGLGRPGDAVDALLRIRVGSTTPVIIVSDDARDESCVVALRLGADDYVARPFNVQVLMARIEALLRRQGDPANRETIQTSNLEIDLGARQAFVDGTEVRLTPIEFDVLAQLAGQPRQVFSREHLLQAVWDSNSDWQSLATVTEHVRRLRQKLGAASSHIVTVFGRGYRFDP